jgi:hypothetical protein
LQVYFNNTFSEQSFYSFHAELIKFRKTDEGWMQWDELGVTSEFNIKTIRVIEATNNLEFELTGVQKITPKEQSKLNAATGKHFEVMVYGDGAFKDPQGKIWELADPCVSPAFTDGLVGTPNELKLKYLADNDFKDLSGDALKEAISNSIKAKDGSLVGNMASQGTTPRQLTDLIGSLCDLTSGSGDKGTPIVLVQGYFDNYTN